MFMQVHIHSFTLDYHLLPLYQQQSIYYKNIFDKTSPCMSRDVNKICQREIQSSATFS